MLTFIFVNSPQRENEKTPSQVDSKPHSSLRITMSLWGHQLNNYRYKTTFAYLKILHQQSAFLLLNSVKCNVDVRSQHSANFVNKEPIMIDLIEIAHEAASTGGFCYLEFTTSNDRILAFTSSYLELIDFVQVNYFEIAYCSYFKWFIS